MCGAELSLSAQRASTVTPNKYLQWGTVTYGLAETEKSISWFQSSETNGQAPLPSPGAPLARALQVSSGLSPTYLPGRPQVAYSRT